ncbi:MAG: hypothetical protein Q8J62_08480 [Candidatus Cloacimonadaceae bacterium]|nr:hypothetical protein [Candidatus Cloacimonadaceae bacterium]
MRDEMMFNPVNDGQYGITDVPVGSCATSPIRCNPTIRSVNTGKLPLLSNCI